MHTNIRRGYNDVMHHYNDVIWTVKEEIFIKKAV